MVENHTVYNSQFSSIRKAVFDGSQAKNIVLGVFCPRTRVLLYHDKQDHLAMTKAINSRFLRVKKSVTESPTVTDSCIKHPDEQK